MLINHKLFIKFYCFYWNNKLKQVKLIKFYSSFEDKETLVLLSQLLLILIQI